MDMILTAAYTEQYHSIGWFQFTLGRVSKLWLAAITHHRCIHPDTPAPSFVISLVITNLWLFLKDMWNHWNGIVHGITVEDTTTCILTNLHPQVWYHYQQFQDDTNYVLTRRQYLFLNRTLEQRLIHSYNYLVCWLHSVEEARHFLAFHPTNLRSEAAVFFPSIPSDCSSYQPPSFSGESTLLENSSGFDSTTTVQSMTSSTSTTSHSDSMPDSDSGLSLFLDPFTSIHKYSPLSKTLIS